ncbi:unnamed protein product [Larinioides sclopetarius]|uniref:CRAL-TRIO domain-containing protein n=1 Tax=Larinioides sclopetarius TaxID=280406 RepID=A0AAV1ZPP6_9ARAC
MIICTQKFRMKRLLQGFVVLFLLFILNLLWIYSKCFNSTLQSDKGDEWEQMEKHKWAKGEENRRTNIEMITNDIEENENYPQGDIRHVLTSIRRKRKDELRQRYEDNQKHVKKLKERIQVKKIQEDEKTISNDIEENETYPIDIRYIPSSIRRKQENEQDQAYDDQKYLNKLKERLQAKWDPDKVPLLHLKQIMFMMYIQALRNPVTQASGLNIIYDFADIGFRYVKFGTPQNLFLLHHVAFEAMPAKYVGYHLVNVNVIGNILVALARPFIPKFIENIFYIHSSVKELHKFFPTSMLPVQYGGNLTDYYATDWIKNANQQHGNFPLRGQNNIF